MGILLLDPKFSLRVLLVMHLRWFGGGKKKMECNLFRNLNFQMPFQPNNCRSQWKFKISFNCHKNQVKV